MPQPAFRAMNRLYDWIFPSRQLLCRFKRPLGSKSFGEISGVRTHATASESLGAPRPRGERRKRHEIRTLRPDRLFSVGQPILNLSHLGNPSLKIPDEVLPKSRNAQNGSFRASYDKNSGKRNPFPTGTRGVFYFHHVRGDNIQSQIRFRLCDTLDEFHHGEDLRGLNSSLWNISLRAMARAPGKQHSAALALLLEEFPVDPRNVDASHNHHRVIFTFNSRELPASGQAVMDISGSHGAVVHAGESQTHLYYQFKQSTEDSTAIVPYPPDTVGVFYYKQSLTAPTRLGELRFRLCRDVQEFAQGEDLRSPSGEPWCVSSLRIYSRGVYKGLRDFLAGEGLLGDSLYPGIPSTLSSTPTMPLQVLSDPFVVDLSESWLQFDIVNDPHATAPRIVLQFMFRNLSKGSRPQPLFSGRAIVRLEEHPGLPPGDNPNGPLVAMRFLEMLTPVRRLSNDDYIQFPQQGQLLSRRRNGGEYVPWGYNPRNRNRRTWLEWIARSRVLICDRART